MQSSGELTAHVGTAINERTKCEMTRRSERLTLRGEWADTVGLLRVRSCTGMGRRVWSTLLTRLVGRLPLLTA